MKKFLVTMVLALSTTAMVAEAWARPMGGKRSFGRQSQSLRQQRDHEDLSLIHI